MAIVLVESVRSDGSTGSDTAGQTRPRIIALAGGPQGAPSPARGQTGRPLLARLDLERADRSGIGGVFCSS
jgi:hypothetical protein